MTFRLIAHEITKNQRSDVVHVQFRDQLNKSDGFAGKFIDDVRSGIAQGNPRSGRFTKPADVPAPFQARLLNYIEAPGESEFVELSQDLTQHLADLMKAVPMATGGYVVFAEHEHHNRTYLLVCILSTKARAAFNSNLELTASEILDLEHLRHAARIQEENVGDNTDGVVQFVSRKATDTADYFLNFLGAESVTDSAEQGRRLFNALSIVADETEVPVDECRQIAFTYWKKCRVDGSPMRLTELANLLHPSAPDVVVKLFRDNASDLAGEFDPPTPKVMKRFVKFTFQSTSFRLEFDMNEWLDNVDFNGTSVTIKDAPTKLIDEIREAKSES